MSDTAMTLFIIAIVFILPIIYCAITGYMKGRKWYLFALLGFLSLIGVYIAVFAKSYKKEIVLPEKATPVYIEPWFDTMYRSFLCGILLGIGAGLKLSPNPTVNVVAILFLIAGGIVGFLSWMAQGGILRHFVTACFIILGTSLSYAIIRLIFF